MTNAVLKSIEDKFTEVETAVEGVLDHMTSLKALEARVIALGQKLKASLAGDAVVDHTDTSEGLTTPVTV